MMNLSNLKKKYAIVFEVSYFDKLSHIVTPKGHLKYDYKHASGIGTPNHYEKFVKDIEYNTSVIQYKKYKALITADFTDVYWDTPEDTFIEEWVFFPRPIVYNPEEKKQMPMGLPVNVRLDEPHEILFQAKKVKKQDIFSSKYENDIIVQDADDLTTIKAFPCKPGTQWKDVEITLTSHEYVTIKTPQGEGSYYFKEINMKDGRTLDKPSDLWTLLGIFCKYSGRIDSKTPIHGFKNLSKSISRRVSETMSQLKD
jgi:hypothetical protein